MMRYGYPKVHSWDQIQEIRLRDRLRLYSFSGFADEMSLDSCPTLECYPAFNLECSSECLVTSYHRVSVMLIQVLLGWRFCPIMHWSARGIPLSCSPETWSIMSALSGRDEIAQVLSIAKQSNVIRISTTSDLTAIIQHGSHRISTSEKATKQVRLDFSPETVVSSWRIEGIVLKKVDLGPKQLNILLYQWWLSSCSIHSSSSLTDTYSIHLESHFSTRKLYEMNFTLSTISGEDDTELEGPEGLKELEGHTYNQGKRWVVISWNDVTFRGGPRQCEISFSHQEQNLQGIATILTLSGISLS